MPPQPDGVAVAQYQGTTSKQELFIDAVGSTIDTASDGPMAALARTYACPPDGNVSPSGRGSDGVALFVGGPELWFGRVSAMSHKAQLLLNDDTR